MTFQIRSLPRDRFAPLFGRDEAELARDGVLVRIADTSPGFPCRVSLEDAALGERVLLLNYEHQSADTPFRARHAIYVREAAVEARPEAGEVPEVLRRRVLSLRAFDAEGMLRAADLAEGSGIEAAITRLLADPRTADLHLHYAKMGCYGARAERV